MAIADQTHSINLKPKYSAPVIVHCSLGDKGRTIRLNVFNGSEPVDLTGCSVTVHGVRADAGNWGPLNCSASGHTVAFNLTTAMTSAEGGGLAEISVSNGSAFVGSANFAIMVERATWSEGVTYSNDVSVYENILAYVKAIQDQMVAWNATLQANINTEASARATADTGLQAQINQIVAPSGEAPSAAEVQNARIGDDNVTYPTLGEAIRTQNANLKSDLNNVETALTVSASALKTDPIFNVYSQHGFIGHTDGVFTSNTGYNVYIFAPEIDTDIYIEDLKYGTTASTLVGAVVYREVLDSLPTSTNVAKQYYINGGRNNDDDHPLPSKAEPWHITKGQMLCIFAQDITNRKLGFVLHYSKLLSLGKKPSIIYTPVDTSVGSRGKEQLSVFLPATVGYIKYAFVRCEYDAYNANIWRIDACYACDESKTVRFPICVSGEWEMAIKINGRSDFIGGNTHGDEVFSSFSVIVDGNHIADITALGETDFTELRIVETSDMYDPSDGATLSTRSQFTPIGTHGREYVITQDGIRLKQNVTLKVAETLDASYMTMLPIIRGNDTVSANQITDHYYADNDYQTYDVSVGASGSDGYGWKRNVSLATIYGDTSGVIATVEMLKQPNIDNNGARQFQVQDTVNVYNKLYWSICGVGGATYNASAGERFDTDTLYKIDVGK